MEELEDVAVGVDATGPADRERLVVPGVLPPQRRHELGRRERDLEADLGDERLHDAPKRAATGSVPIIIFTSIGFCAPEASTSRCAAFTCAVL